MRTLCETEIQEVSGALNEWQAAGVAIMSLSLYSPVTMAFGFPIGAAVFGLGSWDSINGS